MEIIITKALHPKRFGKSAKRREAKIIRFFRDMLWLVCRQFGIEPVIRLVTKAKSGLGRLSRIVEAKKEGKENRKTEIGPRFKPFRG